MKKIMLCLALTIGGLGFSQTQDAWVFFADKEDVANSIANPLTILTQEAIDRKALHNVPIDERDVPVNENYITQVKNAAGITVFAKSKWMNCVYVQGTQANIENLLGLAFVTGIEWADKDLNTFPVGPPYNDKFALENTPGRIVYDYGAATNQIQQINGNFLHEEDFTGAGMIVAVMDSGFPNIGTIPAFADIISENRLLGTYNFVERQTDVTGTGSHGTRTFSDIGGFLMNQFVGTAPEASFYLFRTEFSPTEVPVEEAYWVEAVERADSLGVDVINTSLGYQDYDNPNYDHAYEDLDGMTTFSARGANIAFEKGMLLVTSAGNDGGGFNFVATPADSPGILTVGAVDSNGNYAPFSSVGPTVDGRVKPDVMAQGVSAAVINSSGNVTTSSGTSFSSPIMAGAVACLWQVRPQTPNGEVMQIIRESAHLFNTPTNQMGYGIPDFELAFTAMQALTVEDELLQQQFAIYPNPASDKVNVSIPTQLQTAHVRIFNVLGRQVLDTRITPVNNAIDISRLSSGAYIVSVEGNNQRNSFKLIKR